MYIRWQSRRRSRSQFGWSPDGDVHWKLVLVESARIDGKPRQRHIAYLGSVTESALKLPVQVCHFWDRLDERLGQLGNQLKVSDRTRIETAISAKVPRPTPAEYKDAARKSAEILGWEFITDRQRAALEDEADQWCGNGGGSATKILQKLHGVSQCRCSFCGKSDKQVHTMVASEGVCICDGCVDIAAGLIAARRPENATSTT
jgi:hypothetical protein